MSVDWYVRSQGREVGPVASSQIRAMAKTGGLQPTDTVRQGLDGRWVSATRVKGLFEEYDGNGVAGAAANLGVELSHSATAHQLSHVKSVAECVSEEERKKRLGVGFMSLLLWGVFVLVGVASFGVALALAAAGWVINRILAEYNVRRLQAFGTAVSAEQFPEINRALGDVCRQFEVDEEPRVILLNSSEVNAMAIKFARKKVIVLLSEIVEGVIEKPAELRFILGHEMAHHLLDHGKRGMLEIYKSAAYRAARELTCDNMGTAAAGDVESAKTALKRLGVGNKLHNRLNEDYLETETRYIYSGLTGWLLKQYMTYPPLGKRLANVTGFYRATAH